LGAPRAVRLAKKERTSLTVFSRLAFRIHTVLERHLPEQRLFLKSDNGTHFVRLRPETQAIALVVGTLGLAWIIVATALIMMDTIGAGSARDQAQVRQSLFEERLMILSADRDLRAQEALRAQDRFNAALAQVSGMQEMLLASEDRRRELETGIDVVQDTLRRAIKERDSSRDEVARLTLALNQTGEGATEIGRVRDTAATLDYLTGTLAELARERDAVAAETVEIEAELVRLEDERRALQSRHDAIFAKLEEAIAVSMEPLDAMFRAADLDPETVLDAVRSGYSGQGGPLSPIVASTSGKPLTPEELRANAILEGLDRMNLYRLAVDKSPFAMPVRDNFRWTSGFGYRRDPKGFGSRMHEGVDMAGSQGTAIFATADGVVTYSGWDSGYGRLVKIQHAFGIETRYAHLSTLAVEVGQRVSRGDRIGGMGSSGRSTGTHLHYEIRMGGAAINPMTFIKAATDVF
jgi:murein DD-endopeptidase MepM/ murein hydrolase activator NlpD